MQRKANMASFKSTLFRVGLLQWLCIVLIFVKEGESQQQVTTRQPETKTYEYEYDIGKQYHNETKDANGIVKGEYGHWSPDGWFRITNYTADKDGYRVNRRRLRARKGQFGNSGQSQFPLYSNKPQGGVVKRPDGSAPGGYTPRTPYSPPSYGPSSGVNGIGGAPGLGNHPGAYGTGQGSQAGGLYPSSGTVESTTDIDQHKGGVPALGVHPNQSPGGYPNTLIGRESWTTADSEIVTERPATGLGGIGQYPTNTQTTTSMGVGPSKTIYPGFQQTTPSSQKYKYPPPGPVFQGKSSEATGGDGQPGKHTSASTTGYVPNADAGDARGPFGSGVVGGDKPPVSVSSGNYGAVTPQSGGGTRPYESGLQYTKHPGKPYGPGEQGIGGASGDNGGETPKIGGISPSVESGLPTTHNANTPYGSEVQGTGGVRENNGAATPKTSGFPYTGYPAIPYGQGVQGTGGASGNIGGVTPKTGGVSSSYESGLPITGYGSGPYGSNVQGIGGVTVSYGNTPKTSGVGNSHGSGLPESDSASPQPGIPSERIPLSPGASNAWPYQGATASYPGHAQKPQFPEFPNGQASDQSCRLEPSYSTIPVGFPDNLKPLGVARDDHSTPDGKMIGKYTLTFPFGYIMEISYSAYQDPALAAKYLPQQTHNPNC